MEAWREQTPFALFDVKGCAGRTEFLVILLFWIGSRVVKQAVYSPYPEGQLLILILGLTLSIALVLASIRRLHDIGRSSWWSLLGFVPLGNFVFYLWLATTPGKA